MSDPLTQARFLIDKHKGFQELHKLYDAINWQTNSIFFAVNGILLGGAVASRIIFDSPSRDTIVVAFVFLFASLANIAWHRMYRRHKALIGWCFGEMKTIEEKLAGCLGPDGDYDIHRLITERDIGTPRYKKTEFYITLIQIILVTVSFLAFLYCVMIFVISSRTHNYL